MYEREVAKTADLLGSNALDSEMGQEKEWTMMVGWGTVCNNLACEKSKHGFQVNLE